MIRSLVGLTLLLVVGVVLLLGAAVVTWIASEDLDSARADAAEQQKEAETQERSLAGDLVGEFEEVAKGLVEGGDRRLRLWIAEEPLQIYRDPVPPNAIDVEALRRGISAEMSARSLAESEHVAVVSDRMRAEAASRIERMAAEQRAQAARRAEETASARHSRLVWRLALLLAGMALLLGITLYALVIAPVRRLRASVDQIARGDLATPVPAASRGAQELVALSLDVERMRDQIRTATEGLSAEVARKTESLAKTLEERTKAFEELATTKDRLVQVEKMAGLGTLAGGVAHEFNNLLGGILGCVESAKAGTTDSAAREDLAVAERTAKRAVTLVQALLGVARPGGKGFGPVVLDRVVDDVLRAAQPAAVQRGVAIRREGGGAPPVHGDEGQLHQVVLNLVTNALQAVDDGETVVVSVRTEGRQALFEVRDSGSGIPPEVRPRLFEPFFTARPGGTGLGLFVSYGIVERHGGRIEVGDAPEGGARFTVRLPLSA